MSKLEFGYWDSLGGYEMDKAASAAEVYDRRIKVAQELERLGYHSYWVIEHQNSPVGQCTSPSVYLTAIACHTEKLRLGAMVWQLPFHNPLRLAEEVAMLDNLSHGRVEFGSGIGVHEHEFMRWGLNFYDRAAMSEEVMQVVEMAWTKGEVTFEGKFWKFDEALPAPMPYQKPYPPIWAAAHSPLALDYAARHNYHVAQNIDTDDNITQKFDYFRSQWKSYNHPGPMPQIFLQRHVHVAETDEKAHEEARHYILNARDANPVGGGKIAETRIGWGSDARGMGTDGHRPDDAERGRVFREAAKSYEFSIENGLAIVGSPDTVTRRLQHMKERMGLDLFTGNHQIGAMPHELVENSVKLFGKEVIPAFQ